MQKLKLNSKTTSWRNSQPAAVLFHPIGNAADVLRPIRALPRFLRPAGALGRGFFAREVGRQAHLFVPRFFRPLGDGWEAEPFVLSDVDGRQKVPVEVLAEVPVETAAGFCLHEGGGNDFAGCRVKATV